MVERRQDVLGEVDGTNLGAVQLLLTTYPVWMIKINARLLRSGSTFSRTLIVVFTRSEGMVAPS